MLSALPIQMPSNGSSSCMIVITIRVNYVSSSQAWSSSSSSWFLTPVQGRLHPAGCSSLAGIAFGWISLHRVYVALGTVKRSTLPTCCYLIHTLEEHCKGQEILRDLSLQSSRTEAQELFDQISLFCFQIRQQYMYVSCAHLNSWKTKTISMIWLLNASMGSMF